jgi:hypothetical protein
MEEMTLKSQASFEKYTWKSRCEELFHSAITWGIGEQARNARLQDQVANIRNCNTGLYCKVAKGPALELTVPPVMGADFHAF